MIIRVLDKAYTPVGVIENISSCQYERNWSTCPEFLVQTDQIDPELMRVDNVLIIEGKCGIIEQVSITTDEEGEHVEIRGRGLLSLLDRRVISAKWTFNGTVEAAIYDIINSNLRGLGLDPSGVTEGTQADGENDYTAELGESLMEAVTDIASHARIGLDVELRSKMPTLVIRHGSTRQGWFASENGTLLDKEYDHSMTTYRNVCYANNGDEESPITVEIGDAIGNDRYEHFISESVSQDDNGDPVPEETQRTQLAAKGREALSGLPVVETLNCTINPYGQMEYGVDYDLGDYVLIKAPCWGVELKAHITSITENMDADGFTLSVTFGSNYLSRTQAIKKGVG